MSSPGIEFRQVAKRYGDASSPLVVKGIDLVVPKGTLTTLLGPSGCGKTTTLRMIAGLEAPTSGTILIDGQDVTTLGPAERNVSMVFQSYALFPHMSVVQNVGYGLRVSGVSPAETLRRARGAMELVGLAGFEDRLPSELSGGQQQRVAVARSLVLEPSVMLFDEPLSNLDARLRRNMREEIRALQLRLALTVAYVTHDQSEALAVSDQVIVMEAGRVSQAGSPQQLYEQPASAFVAGFMGEAMLFDAVADSQGGLRLGSLWLPGRAGSRVGPVKLAVRPEAWQLHPGPAPAANRNADTPGLEGTVLRSAYLGSFQEVTVATPLAEIFVVSSDTTARWHTGQTVHLTLDRQGTALLDAA
jgi:iron(III) transport system ATP-binding protein